MFNNEDDIEQLFSNRFKDAEATPENNIWEKLEANLEKQNVEGIYQAAFQNAAVEPAGSVWKKIATALAWKSFLTFKFSTFNIYYASVITAILGFSAFKFLQNDKATDQSSASNIVQQQTESTQNTSLLTQNDIEQTSSDNIETTEKNIASNEKNSNYGNSNTEDVVLFEDLAADFNNSGKKPRKDEPTSSVDWSFVKIVGNNSICKDIPSIYGITGLTAHADIQWNLPKSAKKNSTAGHNISIIWQESGAQTLSATVKINNEKKTFELPVIVEAVAVPVIKGKTKVCQGMEKQLYYVDETINKEISYLWESQQNTIDLIGNKYINVDWTKSGKDTLSVTKINNVTGCKSQAEIGIVIYPQPKIDFEYHPHGENEYEFAFTETQRKGYTYEWQIEGMEYDEPTVIHEISGSGSSFVSLKVTDKNGCATKIQKEVDFDKNFIAVPSKFVLGNGKYFMPLTTATLQTYHIEIYNARNEKIWESSEISDGKPATGWDGQFRGAYQPKGKYMWKITATFDDGSHWKGITQPNGTVKPNGIFVLEN